MTGQQVQPKYSRKCSGILRLSGPNQPKGLILGMAWKWNFDESAKRRLKSSSCIEEEEGERGTEREKTRNVEVVE